MVDEHVWARSWGAPSGLDGQYGNHDAAQRNVITARGEQQLTSLSALGSAESTIRDHAFLP